MKGQAFYPEYKHLILAHVTKDNGTSETVWRVGNLKDKGAEERWAESNGLTVIKVFTNPDYLKGIIY